MNHGRSGSVDQERNASLLLSTTGAAVAGLGLGALLGEELQTVAVAILVVGIVAHLVGMIGNRRAQHTARYHLRWWETGAYWLCWALIVAVVAYLAMSLAGFV